MGGGGGAGGRGCLGACLGGNGCHVDARAAVMGGPGLALGETTQAQVTRAEPAVQRGYCCRRRRGRTASRGYYQPTNRTMMQKGRSATPSSSEPQDGSQSPAVRGPCACHLKRRVRHGHDRRPLAPATGTAARQPLRPPALVPACARVAFADLLLGHNSLVVPSPPPGSAAPPPPPRHHRHPLLPGEVDRAALAELVQHSLLNAYAPQLLHLLWKKE